jgi:hypothetical protein
LFVATLLANALPSSAAQGENKFSENTILVVGAAGGIGQFVCRELLARGYKVRCPTPQPSTRDPKFETRNPKPYKVRGFSRTPEKAQEALAGADIEWIRGDLNKKADLAPAMKGVRRPSTRNHKLYILNSKPETLNKNLNPKPQTLGQESRPRPRDERYSSNPKDDALNGMVET